jgi:Ca2+-binding RTX toxin-like protein
MSIEQGAGAYARQGSAFTIPQGAPNQTPQVAKLADGGFVFVWVEYSFTTTGLSTVVRGQMFDAAGAPVGGPFAVNTTLASPATEAVVTGLAGGGFAVAWTQGGGNGAGDGDGSSILAQRFDAAGAKAGSETLANTTSYGQQSDPHITAAPGGGFAVTWRDGGHGSDNAVRTQIFDAAGAKAGGELAIPGSPLGYADPTGIAALADGRFVIVYTPLNNSSNDLKAQMLAADGSSIGGPIDVDATTSGYQGRAAVSALPAGGFVIVWERSDAAAVNVFAQMYDAAGQPTGGQIPVTGASAPGMSGSLVQALPGGGFVVSWEAEYGPGGGIARAQIFDASGAKLGHAFDLSQGQSDRFPSMAVLDDGRFVAVVEGSAQLFAPVTGAQVHLDASRSAIGETSIQNLTAATLTPGVGSAVNYSYSYALIGDTSQGGFRIEGDRLVVADSSRFDFEQNPSVSVTVRMTDEGGGVQDRVFTFAVTDVVQPETRYQAGPETIVNSRTADTQGGSHVAALPGGGYVVVWTDSSGDSDKTAGVRAQIFDAAGSKVGGELAVNAHVPTSQHLPTVAVLKSGNFVVTWSDQSGDSSGYAIHSQIFDGTGARVGGEAIVNTIQSGNQFNPDVAALPGGGYVVTWFDGSAQGGDTSLGAVRAQIFDAGGTKVGSEFLVNTTTSADQFEPVVATFTDGGFVIAWTDRSASGGDTSGSAIRAQIFDGSGAKLGGELLVNTTTALSQTFPDVIVLASGHFVISWNDNDQEVRAQVFAHDGTALGAELLVNSTTDGQQAYATLSALPGGGFAAAWMDVSQVLAGVNHPVVNGQLFDGNGVKVGTEFTLSSAAAGSQQDTSGITALASGALVATWTDYEAVAYSPSSNTTYYDGDVAVRMLTPLSAPIVGTGGNDVITGTAADDIISGLGGNDILTGQVGADTLDGGDGDDTLNAGIFGDPFAGASPNYNFPDGGNDVDTLIGGYGNDVINAGYGDNVYGGQGFDQLNLDWAGATSGVSPDFTLFELGYDLHIGGGTITGIERIGSVIGSGYGDVIDAHANQGFTFIRGWGGDDVIKAGISTSFIYGGDGDDVIDATYDTNPFQVTLYGEAGSDTLIGGYGLERLEGGSGNDVYRVFDSRVSVVENSNAGTDEVQTILASYALGADVENLTGLAASGQILTGNALANVITGGAGNDVLNGNGGDDVLKGGAGNDVYMVDDAGDTILETAGEGTDEVRTAAVAYTLAANLENLVGTSGGGQQLTGNGGNNAITGGDGGDSLNGGGGDDILRGGGGGDGLLGGDGNDDLDGGDGDDVLFGDDIAALGGTGNDIVRGGLGDDRVEGGGGDDILYGDDGRDVMRGGAGSDRVDGGEGNDFLYGAKEGIEDLAPDTLTGGGGDDQIEARYGDSVDGGTGIDRLILDLRGAPAGVTVDLRLLAGGGTATAAGATITGIEYAPTIFGSDYRDVIAGAAPDPTLERQKIDGRGGDDDLTGTVGADEIYGGDGNDVLRGLSGAIVAGSIFGDRLDGQAGDDILYAGPDATVLTGGIGNDILLGGAGNDNALGGEGDDRIDGGAGDDHLYGEAGTDVLAGGQGSDWLSGDALDLADYSSETGGGGVTVYLTRSNVTAPNGFSYFVGHAVDSWGNTDILDGIENVLTGAGDDKLYGDANDNRLEAGAGADLLEGGGGNDVLDGGAGVDQMAGGAGDDLYYVDSLSDVVTENANEGTDEVRTTVSNYVMPANVEKMTYVGPGAGDLRGNAGDNVLAGGAGGDLFRLQDGGDDTASGGDGNDGFYMGGALTAADRLDGGAGANDQVGLQGTYANLVLGAATFAGIETLILLSGTDTRFGDTAGNRYDYTIKTDDGNVAAGVNLTVNWNGLVAGEDVAFDGSAESDGSFTFFAGFGNDTITGGGGSDGFFFGEAGRFNAADRIDGGAGRDDQIGLRGDYDVVFSATTMTNIETINVLSASDRRYGGAVSSGFTYSLTTDDANVGAGKTLVVTGIGLMSNETLTFDGHRETDGRFDLRGGGGADHLTGGAQSDSLYGGLGADLLTGGAGNDTFLYRSVGESTSGAQDHVVDLTSGDVLNLATIDADTTLGGNQAFAFIGADAFGHHAGELRVEDQGAGNWLVQGDVDGDGVADLQILVTMTDGHALTGADFVP